MQVVETYRSKLRDDLPGAEGEEIARQRIERFANSIRPEAFVVCLFFAIPTIRN